MEIIEKLKIILINSLHLEISPIDISDDEKLFGEQFNLDSLQLMTFIVEIEEEFLFEFDDDLSLESFNSLREIAELVNQKLKSK